MVNAGYVGLRIAFGRLDLPPSRGSRANSPRFLGPQLYIDKKFRTLGFGRAAEREAAAATGRTSKIVEAYARGVNKFNEQHQNQLHAGIFSSALQASPGRPLTLTYWRLHVPRPRLIPGNANSIAPGN